MKAVRIFTDAQKATSARCSFPRGRDAQGLALRSNSGFNGLRPGVSWVVVKSRRIHRRKNPAKPIEIK